ncbi:DUF4974 domain-containing protein [Muricauda sp. DJ-13]|uniref:DUF4974 domain-containing protein n=2 Tax=Croceivirga thetidis TaxID=2721623 RepID=A0ABX1GU67_9FLAO|nr:DUF4974 domain-containing protein [Croceivirga thetidis]
MQENYLAKWLNNELSDEELATFKESTEYSSYKRIAETSKGILSPKFDSDRAWADISSKVLKTAEEPKVIAFRPYKNFLRVAAVLALLLTGSYFYLNTLDTTVKTQLAEQSEVLLPDNSEIFLNADSRVSFSERNWDDERNVSLNGEAFFKVAKGKKFTVSTDQGKVSVLGTQFNVENREGFFEVTCYEGLVGVTFNGTDRKLPAGSSFVVVNGEIKLFEEPKNGQPSWMMKESSFKSIPLKYVLAELERQFNIVVETKDVNTSQLFTGTFSNTNLKLALESISTPTQIRYNLGEEKVLFYAGDTP